MLSLFSLSFTLTIKGCSQDIHSENLYKMHEFHNGNSHLIYMKVKWHTFLPHSAKEILPPASSPAGILLMAFIRRPSHAHITRGLTDIGMPSLRGSPRSSFAVEIRETYSFMFSQSY